ncbi:MAG TPA: Arc family DNA-binding protein [Candidatus Avipropionibacterium avicola]|uniref:Arc family DNA-binding protein n=1 Tax=Candidatus Avipropionibacterium avicola TaxID=2840701 RepID=A0A9D1GZ12_9ACTN|nr:Arc family DNA-binding protein [Candidatus Avipropionibacterium avicola]
MSAITIRKLPDETKRRLRIRAAANGRSMESEARDILTSALDHGHRVDLTWVEELIAAGTEAGGVELELPDDDEATAADFSPR